MVDELKPLQPGGDLERQWKIFKWNFEGYVELDATRSRWNPEKQAKAMMRLIGPDCAYLYSNATEEQKSTVAGLTEVIDANVLPKTNECFERFLYNQIARQPGEDINKFVAGCKDKLKRCGLPEETWDKKIIDTLVHNLGDLQLQQVLFQTKSDQLTLPFVIDSIQIQEASKSQMREVQSCRRIGEVNAYNSNSVTSRTESTRGRERTRSKSYERPRTRTSSHESQNRAKSSSRSRKTGARAYHARSPTPARSASAVSSSSSLNDDCDNCGRQHGSDWCPAENKRCHACSRIGHLATHLFSKSWFEIVHYNDIKIQFKMDTGAEVNIMPKKVLDKIFDNNYKVRPTSIILEAFGGNLLRPMGTITLENCCLNDISLNLDFVVADVESVPLLSLNACEDFGLIKRINSNNRITSTSKICKVSVSPASNVQSYKSQPDISFQRECEQKSSKKVSFAAPLFSISNISEHYQHLNAKYSSIDQIIANNGDVFSSTPVDGKIKPTAIPSRRVPHKLKEHALSRDFLPHNNSDEIQMLQVHTVVSNCKRDSVHVQATNADEVLQELISYVNTSWPLNKSKLSQEAQKFWPIRHDLHLDDSLLYYKHRLVVPVKLRNQVLNQIHKSHHGMVKCTALATETVYWPGINHDIEIFVRDCLVCNKFSSSLKKAPLLTHDVPDFPYQHIACDILEFHRIPYLVVIDIFSKWLDVVKMSSKSAESVCKVWEMLFSIHGIPEIVFADNVPFKSHLCNTFATEMSFQIITCSPHYHQSNGQAENAVKLARGFLNSCSVDNTTSLQKCLLLYRSTPIPSLGVSPSQLLMSRRLRTSIPIKASLLKPCVVSDAQALLKSKQNKMKMNYDKTAYGKDKEFSVGDYVYVQDIFSKEWQPAVVLEVLPEPRSYLVEVGDNILRRNSKFIKPRFTEVAPELLSFPFKNVIYQTLSQAQPNQQQPQNQNSSATRTRTRIIRAPNRLDL
ncbi:hypothetical protein KUF71_024185 [Frankliniella fusca]|uniref:RNA-directed DNA polymerase n=1 Tax=Frankliniella fusca TaxID=407009 RepID=A0AAE1LSV5_9NEOP|nr:hypothetical protein KUF71_024185 [Frankliniella fusca]